MKIFSLVLVCMMGCVVFRSGDTTVGKGYLLFEGVRIRAGKTLLLKLCMRDSSIPAPSNIVVLPCTYKMKGLHISTFVVFHQSEEFGYWKEVCVFPRIQSSFLDPKVTKVIIPKQDSLVVHVSYASDDTRTYSYVYRHKVWHPR